MFRSKPIFHVKVRDSNVKLLRGTLVIFVDHVRLDMADQERLLAQNVGAGLLASVFLSQVLYGF